MLFIQLHARVSVQQPKWGNGRQMQMRPCHPVTGQLPLLGAMLSHLRQQQQQQMMMAQMHKVHMIKLPTVPSAIRAQEAK